MQYYFAYLKLYALFTLNVTSWGTRAGVGGPQAEKTPEEQAAAAKEKACEMEEGFIDQKAKMERKRKIAEKSYWHVSGLHLPRPCLLSIILAFLFVGIGTIL